MQPQNLHLRKPGRHKQAVIYLYSNFSPKVKRKIRRPPFVFIVAHQGRRAVATGGSQAAHLSPAGREAAPLSTMLPLGFSAGIDVAVAARPRRPSSSSSILR